MATQKAEIPFDDTLVDDLLRQEESRTFEVKRIGRKFSRTLESIVAFANTEGGLLIIGLEDPEKAVGRERVFGLQEKIENWDELRRLIRSRVTEIDNLPYKIFELGCTLGNGSKGTLGVIRIDKSPAIHSIVNDGTWIRLDKSNRELTAPEIQELMFARGTITAESQLANIDFDLLETDYWQSYASRRRLTRPIANSMYHIGLAKKDNGGNLRPTKAAVLLFTEEPSGLLASKAAIRVFHYRGITIDARPETNLLKPPKTISGPIIRQIQDAADFVVQELAEGIHMGPLGFEIVQKYPVRVIKEAITNAAIHRDYHINADIHIRLFSDRIEIESPGLFVGPVTIDNIQAIGTHSRNPLIVNGLREFPSPPNIDAGEGVRMMFDTMRQAKLYPPVYQSKERTARDSVMVVLGNQNMPSAWRQVSSYIDQNGWIANKHVRKILRTDDTLKASKFLKEWVDKGLLIVCNPDEGTRVRKYTKPEKRLIEKYIARFGDGGFMGAFNDFFSYRPGKETHGGI